MLPNFSQIISVRTTVRWVHQFKNKKEKPFMLY